MTIELPTPVAHYVAANARLDVDGMIEPFAPDAVVLDVGLGKRFAGHAELRTLFEEDVVPARAIFTPDTARQEGEKVVVEGPAHGDFPSNPIRFTYNFTLQNGTIKALEITL